MPTSNKPVSEEEVAELRVDVECCVRLVLSNKEIYQRVMDRFDRLVAERDEARHNELQNLRTGERVLGDYLREKKRADGLVAENAQLKAQVEELERQKSTNRDNLERVSMHNRELTREFADLTQQRLGLLTSLDTATAEVERLKVDGERLDWLLRNYRTTDLYLTIGVVDVSTHSGLQKARTAIDLARKAQRESSVCIAKTVADSAEIIDALAQGEE